MNTEQLQRANELQKEIKEVENQKDKYLNSVGIYNLNLAKSTQTSGDYIGNIHTKWIDYDVMKTLALKKMDDALRELKTEFENL